MMMRLNMKLKRKAMKILSYISDKVSFAEYYWRKLARRLLSDSASVCNEQSILMKLKKQLHGAQHINQMEIMIKDLTLEKEMRTKFEAYVKREDVDVGLDLNVTVLNSKCWPASKYANINLPKELNKCIDVFKQFYCNEAKNRKLQWIFPLGLCTVEGRFAAKTIELVLSPYQTCLLMLFNDSERLSYGDIKSQSNLEDDDAIRVLHSLACSKYKVLLKKPNTRKISPTDYFEFNSGFTDNKKRIKILVPHSDEEIKVTENVGKDRKVLIDAAIVRIMKAKNGLYFQELLTNCVEQLINHFKPDFTDIKKSMEDLIERELIERDPKDHTLIIYKQ